MELVHKKVEERETKGENVYLSLGSNLGDRENNLRLALKKIGERHNIMSVSAIYNSRPEGLLEQPDFLNLVCKIRSNGGNPFELLDDFKKIEQEMGRDFFATRWGPRIIDIDILLIGDAVIRTDRLKVPHERMFERAFVLVPLGDICNEDVRFRIRESLDNLVDVLKLEKEKLYKHL